MITSTFLISIVVVFLVAALIYWVMTNIGLPDIIVKFGTVILVVFVCLWLLSLVNGGSTPGFLS